MARQRREPGAPPVRGRLPLAAILVFGWVCVFATPALADRAWQSPSGNIVCHYYSGGGLVVCTTMNDGLVTVVGANGRVAHGPNHGTFNYGRGPVVPYGDSIAFANFACDSLSTGMACIERSTCHGFFIARGVHFVSTASCAKLGGTTTAPTAPPIPPTPAPTLPTVPAVEGVAGYPVVCSDGWISSSGGRSGACSHHGGELGGLPKLPAVGGGGLTWVNGYIRKDGTYVHGYYRRS